MSESTDAIPKQFHTIWVQGGELPDEYQPWLNSWLEHHPDWDHIIWSEPMYIDWIENRSTYDSAVNHAQRTEIASKEILYKHGGVYVDADFECFKPIDGLLDGITCFTAYESPGQLSAGIVGCTPGHPALRVILDDVEPSIRRQRELGLPQNHGTGPHILQRNWVGRSDVFVFPAAWFYPYQWNQRRPSHFGGAYAAHHWKATWKK